MNFLQKILLCLWLPFEILYLLGYALYTSLNNFVKYLNPGEPKSLKNEIILVTGGANGIGRELCRRLASAERNSTIISWDVNEEENLKTIELLQALGAPKSYAYTVDVSDREQVSRAAEKIRREFGNVTILFNNAGFGGDINYGWKQNPKLVEKTFGVNMLSHFWTIREFLPHMIESGRGHVVETCSMLGFVYASGESAYAASKFAMRGCFHSIKEELRRLPIKHDIQITMVYPSLISTDMTASIDVRPRRYFFLGGMTSPTLAAEKIVDGVRHNKQHIYIPESVRIMKFLMGIMSDEVFSKLSDLMGLHGMDN